MRDVRELLKKDQENQKHPDYDFVKEYVEKVSRAFKLIAIPCSINMYSIGKEKSD